MNVLALLLWSAAALGGTTENILYLAARAFYGQRCGTAVDLGGGYRHSACHRNAAFHRSSGKSGPRPVPRGWHDAGDYGRYVTNSGIAAGTLLRAWELFPDVFERLKLDIPESGNTIPDLLDEVRWNLEWMLSMQDGDGGVWHKQTSESFPPFVLEPEDDRTISYVIGTAAPPFKSSCATGNLAAVAAMTARIYRPFDPAFADRSLTAARQAWVWLGKHPDIVFTNPPGISTGEYGDKDCRDERLWAAAELWHSARDETAHAYFLANIDEAIGAIRSDSPVSWSEVGAMAAWSAAGESEAIRARTIMTADAIVERAQQHEYRVPMTSEDYVWGSNSVALNYGLHLLIANEFRPDRKYITAAHDIVRYLLGNNAMSISFITGVGTRPVQHPHHRPSAADGIAAPWPGLLAGGPNKNRQDPPTRVLPAGLPPWKVYIDDAESYASNEVAINWNAPLVFVLAGIESAQRDR